jgi:hypothetical protein
MATYEVNFTSGSASLYDGTPAVYYNWGDFLSAVNSLRSSKDFMLTCQNLAETEFGVIEETDNTFTLKRKHYENNEFVGYVDTLAAIDRINYVSVNDISYHQSQIAAMNISGQALEGCI